MPFRSMILVILLSAYAGLLGAATPTDTSTVSPTFTVTRTASPNFSPTLTTTATGGPTTATRTTTGTPTRTFSPTISPTWTASPTPAPQTQTHTTTRTVTRTATPPAPTAVPTLDPQLDDFEDGNFVGTNGGSWTNGAGGTSSIVVTLTAGCTLTQSTYAAHCSGTRGSDINLDYANFTLSLLPGNQPVDVGAVVPSHAVTFSYKGDYIGADIYVSLFAGASYAYEVVIPVTDLAWHQVTVYFPDVDDPSLTPRLADDVSFPWSSYDHQVQSISFGPAHTGSSYSYGFSIDDVHFGEPTSNNSPAAVAAALGVPVAQVQDAYDIQLDEQLTWVVLRLAAHCGCTPQQIMTMRETRSWGQIATDVGTTWATVLAEVDAAPLAQPVIDVARMERGLYNGPLPPPRPAAQFYVPSNAYVLPTPTGSCP